MRSNEMRVGKRGNLGVSEVVGNIFVIAILIAGTSILLVYGFPTIDENKNKIRMRNIVSQMSIVNEQIAKVYMDVAPTTTIRIALSDGSIVISNGNNFLVRVYDPGGGLIHEINDSMGKIEYTYRSNRGVFENGGVWVDDLLVTPPRITVDNGSITMALIKIQGSGSAGGKGFADLTVRYNSSQINRFETSGYVEITFTSDYADKWSEFFQSINATVNGNTARLNFTRLIIAEYTVNIEV
jgi:competence protein ComGC